MANRQLRITARPGELVARNGVVVHQSRAHVLRHAPAQTGRSIGLWCFYCGLRVWMARSTIDRLTRDAVTGDEVRQIPCLDPDCGGVLS
jgi:hypothetical protein